MHLHTYVMLRCCTFSCTCTHTSCYAAVRSHALAHIRHATLLYVLMHLHTYVMLRCCTFSCTCTHTSCYAAVRSHALAQIWVKYKGASTKAGTQLADRNWDQLDSWLPRSITTLQKGKLNPALYEYAYSWFWRYNHLSQDMDVAKALHKLGCLAAPAWKMGLPKCHLQNDQHSDDDDDDDDEIAPDAKVSFFSVLWSPL